MSVYKSSAMLLLAICVPAMAQTSFWTNASTPAQASVTNDSASVNLGLRFYSEVPGTVTGVRFYKGSQNLGTHVGNLWSSSGVKLAEVTFSSESSSGWQQAMFASPVKITANTVYTVSYLAPRGSYAINQSFPWTGLSASPLRVSGSAPGIYAYGSGPQMPTNAWYDSNYWVDVMFTSDSASSPSTTTSQSIWSSSITPAIPEVTNDTKPVTLGLQFQSTVAGYVTGVRFYKGPRNTGTHVGMLWSSSGTMLASVQFTGETASGWQQANFSPPVAVAANTTYVISYLAPNGYYAVTQYYGWATPTPAPLKFSGSSPGVFAYGNNGNFPSKNYARSNYWVDVVFTTAAPASGGSWVISGTVSGSPATLTLSGNSAGSATTDGTGKFSFSGLTDGLYVIAPSQSGYVFSPSTASVTVNGASVNSVNFTAAKASKQVILSWNASASENITGYNVYRSGSSGGPYQRLNSSPLATVSYGDSNVTGGQAYYYVTTAVDSSNIESAYSNEAAAAIPLP